MADRAVTAGLSGLAVVVLSLGLALAAATGARQAVAVQFVTAANRGDYGTVCHLYSPRYERKSQASCVSLYRWGAGLYWPV